MPSGTVPPNVGAKLLIICELAKFLRCFLHFRLPTRLCNTIWGAMKRSGAPHLCSHTRTTAGPRNEKVILLLIQKN